MDEAGALREQHEELGVVLAAVGDVDWSRPVPRCPGWTVADVVLHLAQSDELALASVAGRFADVAAELMRGATPGGETVDDVVDAMVVNQRGAQSGVEVRARCLDAGAALDAALAGADPHARVPWVAGDLSVRTMATTRLAENWIHTGDVAAAVGAASAVVPGERLRHVARLAWRTLPYAFSRGGRTLSGPVAFDLVGPTGAPWRFGLDRDPPATTITGAGVELCLVAARRVAPGATSLVASGPDGAAVLELVRTYA